MQRLPAQFEQSESNEQKIVTYLYDLTFKGITYRLTNYSENVVYQGVTYTACAIAHTESNDADKSLAIMATLENGFLREFFLTTPVGKMTTRIYRINDGLPNPETGNGYIIFSGEVVNISFKGAEIGLACVPLSNASQSKMPNCFCSNFCQWKLFSVRGCKLDQASFTTDTSIVAHDISNKTIVIDAVEPSANYWALGQFIYDGINYMILKSDGDTLTLADFPTTINDSELCQVVPGCNKTVDQCSEKFGNIANFGGHPYIPSSNPTLDGV